MIRVFTDRLEDVALLMTGVPLPPVAHTRSTPRDLRCTSIVGADPLNVVSFTVTSIRGAAAVATPHLSLGIAGLEGVSRQG